MEVRVRVLSVGVSVFFGDVVGERESCGMNRTWAVFARARVVSRVRVMRVRGFIVRDASGCGCVWRVGDDGDVLMVVREIKV